MNQRFLLAAAASLGCLAATPSFAQEHDWSGFYVGANAGAAWGDTRMHISASNGTSGTVIPPGDIALINGPVNSEDNNDTGWAAGIQAGFNAQSGSFVWGVETDFGFLDLDQNRANTYQSPLLINPPINFTVQQETSTDWLWTIRPRIGFASGPWMVYGTGGVAVADVELTTRYSDTRSPPNAVNGKRSRTATGWIGGLGGAYAFSDQMSVRGEWMYVDLGSIRDNATGPYVTLTSTSKVRGNMLRVGLDYKFW